MLPSNPLTADEAMGTSCNLIAAMPQLFAGVVFSGDNPDVFQYRLRLPDAAMQVGCVEMQFYGGFRVCVLLRSDA